MILNPKNLIVLKRYVAKVLLSDRKLYYKQYATALYSWSRPQYTAAFCCFITVGVVLRICRVYTIKFYGGKLDFSATEKFSRKQRPFKVFY